MKVNKLVIHHSASNADIKMDDRSTCKGAKTATLCCGKNLKSELFKIKEEVKNNL